MSNFAFANSFSNDELAKLTEVFTACCDALGVTTDERFKLRRELIARVIFDFAMTGETDPRVLKHATLLELRMAA